MKIASRSQISTSELLLPMKQALLPENGIEKEYWPDQDPAYVWRGYRCLIKTHLPVISQVKSLSFPMFVAKIYDIPYTEEVVEKEVEETVNEETDEMIVKPAAEVDAGTGIEASPASSLDPSQEEVIASPMEENSDPAQTDADPEEEKMLDNQVEEEELEEVLPLDVSASFEPGLDSSLHDLEVQLVPSEEEEGEAA